MLKLLISFRYGIVTLPGFGISAFYGDASIQALVAVGVVAVAVAYMYIVFTSTIKLCITVILLRWITFLRKVKKECNVTHSNCSKLSFVTKLYYSMKFISTHI